MQRRTVRFPLKKNFSYKASTLTHKEEEHKLNWSWVAFSVKVCFSSNIGFVSIIREKVLNLKGAFQGFNRPLSRLLLLQFHAKAIVRLIVVGLTIAFAWNCSSNNLLSGLLNVLFHQNYIYVLIQWLEVKTKIVWSFEGSKIFCLAGFFSVNLKNLINNLCCRLIHSVICFRKKEWLIQWVSSTDSKLQFFTDPQTIFHLLLGLEENEQRRGKYFTLKIVRKNFPSDPWSPPPHREKYIGFLPRLEN